MTASEEHNLLLFMRNVICDKYWLRAHPSAINISRQKLYMLYNHRGTYPYHIHVLPATWHDIYRTYHIKCHIYHQGAYRCDTCHRFCHLIGLKQMKSIIWPFWRLLTCCLLLGTIWCVCNMKSCFCWWLLIWIYTCLYSTHYSPFWDIQHSYLTH